MEKITQVEDNEEYPHPNLEDHQFVLLLRVTQADGQPLPMGRIHEQSHGTNDM